MPSAAPSDSRARLRQQPVDIRNIPEQLTIGQAAWLLRVGHSKIHRDIKAGKIAVVNLNACLGLYARPLYRVLRDEFLKSHGLKHLLAPTPEAKKGGAA